MILCRSINIAHCLGIDMLNEIAKRLQFNYSIRLVADAAYGKEEQSGRWTGIIGELSRRVCCSSFLIEKKKIPQNY